MLTQAGVYRMLIPAKLGGLELPPAAFMEVLDRLAQGDAATAWCGMIGATATVPAGYMAPEAARDVFGDPGNRYAGVFAPAGRAQREGESYRVSGRWDWASGSRNATWLSGGCRINGSDPAEARMVFFPADDVVLHDTWHSAGLCGTGSGAMSVTGIAVPVERAVSITQDKPSADGPLYRFPVFGLLALGIAAVALGNATASIDEFEELARHKIPQGARRPLIDRSAVQELLGQSRLTLQTARDRLADSVGAAWQETEAGAVAGIPHRATMRMAAADAARTAADITREVYFAGGGSSVYSESPLQRRFRDAHVMTQHMMVAPAARSMAARALAGEKIDQTFV